jgi:hypothetical protein
MQPIRFCAALAVMVTLAMPAAASPSSGKGGLHGIVTGRTDGLGVSSVSVTLRAIARTPSAPATQVAPFVAVRSTDLEGVFRFDDLPAGLYSIEARINGLEWADFAPILVVPGLEVREHLVLGESTRIEAPSQT